METLLKKFRQRSQTKVPLSVIELDVRMEKLLDLLELKLSLVWDLKNRLVKDLLNRKLIIFIVQPSINQMSEKCHFMFVSQFV